MKIYRRLRAVFRKEELNQQLSDELAFHLAKQIDQNIAAGMSPDEARYAALRKFGGVEQVKEECRDAWGMRFIDTLLQDIRYGLRMLAKNPGFTAVAVVTLALGIGANTAIFTLINAVLLQSLPLKNPGQLVLFYDGAATGTNTSNGIPNDIYSYPAWEYFRDHDESFEGLCAFRQESDRLTLQMGASSDPQRQEQVRGHLVSGSYFTVLGVQAAAGRLLTAQDDIPTAPPGAVISYDFWRRRFNLDRSVMGKTVDLNGTVFTIVGVTPREFFGERVGTPPDFWLPLSWQPQVLQRGSWLATQDLYWLNLMGRLKPGVTAEIAQANLNTQLHQYYTAQAGSRITPERQRQIQSAHIQLKPGARGISVLRFAYSEPLHVLMAVVALVLLIACANVATLMLARASARRQELFVRLALGARRSRLVRQLLTESVLLALFGALAGAVLAGWGVHLLVAMLPLASVVEVKPDLLVLGFTLAVSVLTGVLFGLMPALRSSKMGLTGGAAARSSASSGGSTFKPAYTLVVLQVALSSVLLVGAALLTHSLLDLERQDLGFNSENVLLVSTGFRLAGVPPAELLPLYRQIQERLNSLPGATSASMARFSPISGGISSNNFSLAGYEPPAEKAMNVYKLEVGPGFFETLGVPLLLGHPFGPQDTPASPFVAVVNETFVQEYLPNQNPIGRRMSIGSPFKAPGAEIIGVVADSKYYNLREKPKPMAFFSLWQAGADKHLDAYAGELMIRTSRDPSGAIAEVRRVLIETDSRLPILGAQTLHDQIYESLNQERMITKSCSFFGLLALVLACIGLYGTMAYSVARRTNEIGIRMALGAQRSRVLWLFLRDSVALVALGLTLGLPLAMSTTRWIKSLLFGLPPVDWLAFGGTLVLMVAVSGLASYLPARRATKVDPMVALRYE
ncbi:MAG: ABC transporter permease [Terriglobia bacterium]|jgi:predicted permease